jgi:C4-dicarboxylate transporter, DctM subunit
MIVIILMFLIFLLLLALSVPVGISMGISTMVTILVMPFLDVSSSVVFQRMFAGMESSALMAVPLFILAGNIMTHGGISRRLVEVSNSVVGRTRGGIAIGLVFACALFAALSGSAPATTVAIGSMLYAEMTKIGYPKKQTGGLLVVAGGLGPVIPPSIVMILFASLTSASVADMFANGALIGIVMAVALVAVVLIEGRRQNWPKAAPAKGELLPSLFKALPAFALPVFVLGGIYSGILTPTESAGIAVIWALVASMFIYKELRLKDLPQIILGSAKTSSMVLFIVAASSAFAYVFAISGATDEVVDLVTRLDPSPLLFCILVAVVLLLLGIFIEGIAVTVLLVPVLWPMADALGIDVVHFGMIFSIAAVVGAMTPPVGVNLFAASSVTGLSMGELFKGQWKFFLAYFLIFAAVVLFPQFSTLLSSG